MPETLFISYARADGHNHALSLNDKLTSAGHDVFFDKDPDRGIKGGVNWQKALQDGIDNCSVFLFLVTPKSVQSDFCFFERGRALLQKKTIIPLMMKPTDGTPRLPDDQLPFVIDMIQYIDFSVDFDKGYEQLTYRLTQLEDENFQKEQAAARQRDRLTPRVANGRLVTRPHRVPRLPEILIGRDSLKTQIHSHIAEQKTVMLHGLGGVGKSALTARVIADVLGSNPQTMLWLEVGNASSEQVFARIGEAFDVQQEMFKAQTDEAKQDLTYDLIQQKGVKIVVIDDAWNPAALQSLMKAVRPIGTNTCVIVTSRHRQGHITGGEMIPVDALSSEDANTLLIHHASRADMNGADDLCKALYYHPFLLEIAGKLLRQRDISPQRLLDELDDISTLEMPEGVAEPERENMGKLLQKSLEALPDDLTRAVFMAFGHLPTTIVTPELLALLLRDDIGMMNITAKVIDELGGTPPIEALDNLKDVGRALETLVIHGLVERLPEETQDGYPYNVERFRLHDLAHSYASNRTDAPHRTVSACLVYTWRHNTRDYNSFSALRSELENLMEASTTAMTLRRWWDAENFAWNLYRGSQFTDYQGYYTQAVTLLTQASEATNQRGDQHAQGNHLGNLGIVYKNLGQYETAIEHHQQALAIVREIGAKHAEGSILGNLGIVYEKLGQYETAIDYYLQDLAIREQIGDIKGKGNALGNLGNAYASLEQYETAIDYYQQRLAIAEQIGDLRGKGNVLGNLGIAYNNIGSYETAIDYYLQATEIRRQIGDRKGLANDSYNLGVLYIDLDRYAEAIPLLEEALTLFTAMGVMHDAELAKHALDIARRGASGGD